MTQIVNFNSNRITEEEKVILKRTMENMNTVVNTEYQTKQYLLDSNDLIGNKMYDGIIQKAMSNQWLPYSKIKTYLEKLDYILKKNSEEDSLTSASNCIRYTILVDGLKEKILELPEELSYQLVKAFAREDISYTQYPAYGKIMVKKDIVEELQAANFPYELSRVMQDCLYEISCHSNIESQTEAVLQSIKDRKQQQNKKSLFKTLCEQERFTFEELSNALLEQMNFLNELIPTPYSEEEQASLKKIVLLQYLSTEMKEEYMSVIRYLLNQSFGICELLKRVTHITEIYYEYMKKNSIAYYNFTDREEHNHENR